jgi:uncharacterized low-complexity protein
MKKILTLLSILAFTFTFAQAEMKCQAGKCGASMAEKTKEAKTETASKCGNTSKEMKCQAGKCGADAKKVMPEKSAEAKGK